MKFFVHNSYISKKYRILSGKTKSKRDFFLIFHHNFFSYRKMSFFIQALRTKCWLHFCLLLTFPYLLQVHTKSNKYFLNCCGRMVYIVVVVSCELLSQLGRVPLTHILETWFEILMLACQLAWWQHCCPKIYLGIIYYILLHSYLHIWKRLRLLDFRA